MTSSALDYLPLVCGALVAGVFLVSAVSKLRGRGALRAFAGSLSATRLLPARLVGPAALVLALGESATVALLVVPVRGTMLAGYGLAVVLLAVLAAGVATVSRRGVHAPCRCFGAGTAPLGRRHLLRNLLLLTAALLGGAVTARPVVRDAGVLAGLDLVGIVVAVAIGLLGAVVVVMLDDLVELFSGPPTGGAAGTSRPRPPATH